MSETEVGTEVSRDERRSWVEPELVVTTLKDAMGVTVDTPSLFDGVGYS